MRIRRLALRGGWLLAAALPATAASVTQGAPPSTVDFGLAVYDFVREQDVVVCRVAEFDQGTTDLNGDGDAQDLVYHVVEVSTGVATNLLLAGSADGAMAIDGRWVALVVHELVQDAQDLNGDGDPGDHVLHVHDLVTGVTQNLGLALLGAAFALDGDFLAFPVWESAQGNTDLNGDSDTLDYVLHVRDLAAGTTANLGLAVQPFSNCLSFGGGHFVFLALEPDQGVDLNGDGDIVDPVLHTHDLATGVTTSVGLAGPAFDMAEGRVAMVVHEELQGGLDLNGDGDTTDFNVLHVHDLATGVTTNLGLSVYTFELEDEIVVMRVAELFQGGLDLNGDGDTDDPVHYVHDLTDGTTTNLQLAGHEYEVDGRLVALTGSEFFQGNTDLNGDGDSTDNSVLHVFDAVSGTLVDLGLAIGSSGNEDFSLRQQLLAFHVRESDQGASDLNGDGDAGDIVLHVHDAVTHTTTSYGLAVASSWLTSEVLVVLMQESEHGATDLNGDGDAVDGVLHLVDPSDGTVDNLALAGLLATPASLGGSGVFYGLESGQGVDLNGDGDLDDFVLHAYQTAVLHGLTMSAHAVSLAAGGAQVLTLAPGAENDFALYYLLTTTAGTSPGSRLPPTSLTLPLNFSGLLLFTALNPNLLVQNSLDFLDADGQETATMTLAAGLDPGLAGVTLHHAYMLLELVNFTATFVSNPVPLTLIP